MCGQYHVPATLPPGKTRYLWHRRLLGPQAGLDWCGKSRNRYSITGPPNHYTYYAIPVAIIIIIIIIIIIPNQLGPEFL